MPDFIYSAKQIAELTAGHVVLKTLNNWSNKNLWRSRIDYPSRGKPRLYSRANVLEAVIGSRMQFAGIVRKDFLRVLQVMATRQTPTGWSGELFDRAVEHPSFGKGSRDWYWAIAWKVIAGAPVIDAADSVEQAQIAEWIEKKRGDYCLILPISEIVASVDALDPEA